MGVLLGKKGLLACDGGCGSGGPLPAFSQLLEATGHKTNEHSVKILAEHDRSNMPKNEERNYKATYDDNNGKSPNVRGPENEFCFHVTMNLYIHRLNSEYEGKLNMKK